MNKVNIPFLDGIACHIDGHNHQNSSYKVFHIESNSDQICDRLMDIDDRMQDVWDMVDRIHRAVDCRNRMNLYKLVDSPYDLHNKEVNLKIEEYNSTKDQHEIHSILTWPNSV